MKWLLWITFLALLFLAACNEVESFEGEAYPNEDALMVGCGEAIAQGENLVEDFGYVCEVQLSDGATIVDESGEKVPIENLEGRRVRVMLEEPERIRRDLANVVMAEKIIVLNE